MQVVVLASSSSGNSIYIEEKNFKCLVDAGISAKKLIENLEKIGRKIQDIDCIFITHEHIDHVRAISVLAKKYNIPIYANNLTWQHIKGANEINSELKFSFEKEEEKDFSDVRVTSFGVSHDAVNPQFYTFESSGKKLSILTDTGYVSDKMIAYIKNSDALIYETNHEENILLSSRYPWKTKQRILSDRGHLSNNDAAKYLKNIIGDKTKNIFLAHLSQENNTKDLARMTVLQELKQANFDVEKKIKIRDTDPMNPTKKIEI